MRLRVLISILAVLLVLLQYRLWVGDGSLGDLHRLRGEVKAQQATNDQIKERNRALAGEVKDLKQGLAAIEERARSELGMVKKDETFYQVVDGKRTTKAAPADNTVPPVQASPASPPVQTKAQP
jgi:cell division protein FtsB